MANQKHFDLLLSGKTLADLRNADLRSANLSDANLLQAHLCWADIRRAILCHTNLKGVN